jgi:hypothetical protein
LTRWFGRKNILDGSCHADAGNHKRVGLHYIAIFDGRCCRRRVCYPCFSRKILHYRCRDEVRLNKFLKFARRFPTIFRTTARRFRTTIRYSVEKLEHPWSACRNYSQCASHSKHCSKSKTCTTPASALRVRNENVMRGVCSHHTVPRACRWRQAIRQDPQQYRSFDRIWDALASIVGAGKFTNESQVRIAFAWVLRMRMLSRSQLEDDRHSRLTVTSTSSTAPGLHRTDV